MSAPPPLRLEREGDVATLWLDAPPRNETDLALFDALARLCAGTLPGLGARGLVVAGRGRHFSSGANVAELRRAAQGLGAEAIAQVLRAHRDALCALEALPYPVVAAIDGCCLGSGFELALACGHRVASTRALLGLPESTFGLMPGCGGTVRLAERVGPGPALELVLTGRSLQADEALRLGAVDAVVAPQALHATAAELARRLSRGPDFFSLEEAQP